MQLERSHPSPVYMQLTELLKSQIAHGQYCAHQQLPSERQLCQEYGLSRMTVHRAMQMLIAEGWAYTRSGKGTFVSEHSHLTRKEAAQAVGDWEDGSQFREMVERIKGALLAYDSVACDRLINQVFASFAPEVVTMQMFPALLREIGEMWERGEASVAVEHFASNLVRGKVLALLNASRSVDGPSQVVAACAPGDFHEIGLLVLTLHLRRLGYGVVYLGQNVPLPDFSEAVKAVKPKLLCLSSALVETAELLDEVVKLVQRERKEELMCAFGGPVFERSPDLARGVRGIFMGTTLPQALATTASLLAGPVREQPTGSGWDAMIARDEVINLLPVRAVLFPGMVLPLEIDGEAAKHIVCNAVVHGQILGVVLDDPQLLEDRFVVGTTASVRQVAPLADGRLSVTVVGQERFVVRSLLKEPATGLAAQVDPFPVLQSNTGEVSELAQQVASLLRRYMERHASLSGQRPDGVEIPTAAEQLAFLAGTSVPGSLHTKQRLLSSPSVLTLLDTAADILQSEDEILSMQMRLYTAHHHAFGSVEQRFSRA